jgi:hypothetical protein
MHHQPGFPQNLLENQLVTLTNIEGTLVIHDLRSTCGANGKPSALRTLSQERFDQQGNPCVSKNRRMAAGPLGIERRFGKHVVEKSPNPADRIVDEQRDAGSKGIGHKGGPWIRTHLTVSDAHNH